VRVVSACQSPLRDAVQRGAFRADLHARLSGYVSVLPPLRARPEDIAHLFATFVRRQSGGRPPAIEAKLVEQLCLYAWPDNVRELELLTRRLLILHGHEPVLRRAFLPDHVSPITTESAPPEPIDEGEDRRTHDLRRLVAALRRTDGNLTKAVASLGISRQRAYRLMGDRTTEQLLASFVSAESSDRESSGS
jgi:two-component system NtrC family response regulator